MPEKLIPLTAGIGKRCWPTMSLSVSKPRRNMVDCPDLVKNISPL